MSSTYNFFFNTRRNHRIVEIQKPRFLGGALWRGTVRVSNLNCSNLFRVLLPLFFLFLLLFFFFNLHERVFDQERYGDIVLDMFLCVDGEDAWIVALVASRYLIVMFSVVFVYYLFGISQFNIPVVEQWFGVVSCTSEENPVEGKYTEGEEGETRHSSQYQN